jgi:Domain of unknown function (DUF6316)
MPTVVREGEIREGGVREGESAGEWNRSSRTFLARGGWHVRTREGHALGPYPTEFDAQVVAALLIAQLAQATNPQACRRIIYNFRHDDRFKTVTAAAVVATGTERQFGIS